MINILYKIRNTNYFYYDDRVRKKFDELINYIVPIMYSIIPSKKLKKHNKKNKSRVIVSLTTIPSRIDKTWIVVENMLRQSYKPDKIVMWLGKDKFEKVKLPDIYKQLMKKGLEIKYVDDICAHTKYYYAFQNYPDDIIITVDDDICYPKDTIKGLIETHKRYPKAVCAHWVWEMKFSKKGLILPCKKFVVGEKVENKKPNHYFAALGVGGVLYPPKCVGKETFNRENIIKLSFRADDIWLKGMELLNNTKIAKVNEKYKLPLMLVDTQKEALRYSNVYRNGDDEQLKQVFEFFNISEDNFK